jgi:preprotein translocase subunit YajC
MPSPQHLVSVLLGHSDAGTSLLAQAGEPVAPALSPIQQILSSPFLLMGSLMAMFYFIVLLPDKRRRASEADRLASVKKNDRIVTIGGIHGVVSAIGEGDTLTIRLDENGSNKMKIDRKAVARIVSDRPDSE